MINNRGISSAAFKRDVVRLVTDQRYGVAEPARNLRFNVSRLGH
jgi:hypothetical protein